MSESLKCWSKLFPVPFSLSSSVELKFIQINCTRISSNKNIAHVLNEEARTFFNVFKLDETATRHQYVEFSARALFILCVFFFFWNLLSELNKKPFVHIFIWAISSVNSNFFLSLFPYYSYVLDEICWGYSERKKNTLFLCSHFAWIFNKINDSNFLEWKRLKNLLCIFIWLERKKKL